MKTNWFSASMKIIQWDIFSKKYSFHRVWTCLAQFLVSFLEKLHLLFKKARQVLSWFLTAYSLLNIIILTLSTEFFNISLGIVEAYESCKCVGTAQRREPGSIHGTKAVLFCYQEQKPPAELQQNQMDQLPEVSVAHLKEIPGWIEPVSNRPSCIERMLL